MKHKPVRLALIGVIILFTLAGVRKIHAQGDSTTTVINAVNQLRVGQNLPALLSHPDLMEIAQQHSQFQASLGSETSIGEEGSTPEERAEESGFGSGADIVVFENDACGNNYSIQDVLDETWDDSLSQRTLNDPEVEFIGAGIGYAGDLVCYTVITGYWEGEPDPTRAVTQTPSTPSSSIVPTAVPVMVSTPLADGTVKHTVDYGQALSIIASVYNVALEELRELNGLDPDTVVNPGDEVIIQPSYTPTRTPIGEPSPTLPLRYTHTPSPVGFEASPVVISLSPSPSEEGVSETRFRSNTKNPTLVITAVLISGATLAGALIISLRSRD